MGVYSAERIASFIGFAPVDEPPRLAALVVLYNPKVEGAYGGVLVAPVSGRLWKKA